ncbi:hypothetical protein ACKZDW_02305 (plasmid) [Ralstonia syzygii subsp. celebesensis]|uniref:hypothetical protein n=1 Tax=Ralstonia syzygii TaxID=28097 RepID=UPI00387E16A1
METELLQLIGGLMALVLLAGVPTAWAIASAGQASDARFRDELRAARAERQRHLRG